MNKELLAVKELLAGEYTCVVRRGEAVYTTTARGVRPLVTWLDQGLELAGGWAADRVVGRATAFLYCLLGVRGVYAHVMSSPAIQVLTQAGIHWACGSQVSGIINRRGDGPCPFEAAVLDISDSAQALEAIRRRMEEMGIR